MDGPYALLVDKKTQLFMRIVSSVATFGLLHDTIRLMSQSVTLAPTRGMVVRLFMLDAVSSRFEELHPSRICSGGLIRKPLEIVTLSHRPPQSLGLRRFFYKNARFNLDVEVKPCTSTTKLIQYSHYQLMYLNICQKQKRL
jgi:hypothetical protein